MRRWRRCPKPMTRGAIQQSDGVTGDAGASDEPARATLVMAVGVGDAAVAAGCQGQRGGRRSGQFKGDVQRARTPGRRRRTYRSASRSARCCQRPAGAVAVIAHTPPATVAVPIAALPLYRVTVSPSAPAPVTVGNVTLLI